MARAAFPAHGVRIGAACPPPSAACHAPSAHSPRGQGKPYRPTWEARGQHGPDAGLHGANGGGEGGRVSAFDGDFDDAVASIFEEGVGGGDIGEGVGVGNEGGSVDFAVGDEF